MKDKVCEFADPYKEMRRKQCFASNGCQISDLSQRPLVAMHFWTTMVYEKVGTNNPAFPGLHRHALNATVEAFENRVDDEAFIRAYQKSDFAEAVWERFLKEAKIEADKKRVTGKLIGPVKGILELLREAKQPNFILLLAGKEPKEAWDELQKKPTMNGIGKKVASFVLREIATFFRGWEDANESKWDYFQPLDRWVLRWCRILWGADAFSGDAPPNDEEGYLELAKKIRGYFENPSAAAEFNMGAWFLGANRDKILARHNAVYCGSDEFSDAQLIAAVQKMNPDTITQSICVTPDEVIAILSA